MIGPHSQLAILNANLSVGDFRMRGGPAYDAEPRRILIDERNVFHRERFIFRIHHDLMPSIQ